MNKSVEKRILQLRKLIDEHDYRYYVLTEPTVSDYDYDLLVKELEKLEKEYPEYITAESPTQRVGSDLTKIFKPIQHDILMLSLSNTYSEDELIDFNRRVKQLLPEGTKIEYFAELKIDGVSVSLRYEKGKLVTAATRGDGAVGEEITNNVKTIRAVPLIVRETNYNKLKLQNIEVRGEIFMEIEEFNKFNAEREANEEKTFANPRNSTAGTLKLQDPKMVARRPLDIFIYYLSTPDLELISQNESIKLLLKLGFKVNKNYRLCKNINEVLEFCREWEKKRDILPYEIDGVVVKVNSFKQQKLLGSIAKAPRWAVAYKFKSKQAVTKLLSITWQVGRTGAITPVAELKPVLLAGSTISRATLHNIDEIKRKDIREGDSVVIEKGGDVIPKIVSVILSERGKDSKKMSYPSICPVCGTPLFQPENEVAVYCENNECPAQVKGRIEHFASRGAMDIEGLGVSLIDQFVDLGYLLSYADIYELKSKRDELINIERLGEKSIDNLLSAIEKSKEKPFSKVLFAIGIRYVGAGAARKLTESFTSIDELISATEEEIQSVPEIGPSISKSIKRFFSDEHNIQIIHRLNLVGLNFKSEQGKIISEKLINKTFILTGTLSAMTRDEAKEKIMSLGGKVTSSLSKNTDYVIAGDKPGSKMVKAQKLGITILPEEEFLKIVRE